MSSLESAAGTVIEKCLSMKAGERLLIVSNPDTEQAFVAEALRKAATERGVLATLLLQPVKNQGEYAEDYVLDAIASKPDCLASISAEKLGKDKYRIASPMSAPDGRSYDHIFHYLLHGTKEMRAFWSPGITVDMFTRTVAIDYARMRSRALALKAVLDEAEALLITAPSGTDIVVGVRGRKAYIDDGDFSLPGSGGNLPAGDVNAIELYSDENGNGIFDGQTQLHVAARRRVAQRVVLDGFVSHPGVVLAADAEYFLCSDGQDGLRRTAGVPPGRSARSVPEPCLPGQGRRLR